VLHLKSKYPNIRSLSDYGMHYFSASSALHGVQPWPSSSFSFVPLIKMGWKVNKKPIFEYMRKVDCFGR